MAQLHRATFHIACLVLLTVLGATHGAERRYYIEAKEVAWDYGPGGTNLADPDDQASADQFLKPGPDRVGGQYIKTVYIEYTDDTFTQEKPKPNYMGLLGPLIHAEVGDSVIITYRNSAPGVFSVHPHGLFYLKNSEGAVYIDGTSGKTKKDEIVFQGETVVLTWNVTDSDAPAPSDPNCLPWVYHSHVSTGPDTSAGLVGVVVTCKPGVLNDKNERTDVDVEFPLVLKNFDENLSWNIDKSIDAFCPNPVQCHQLKDDEDEDFINSNYMRAINGRMFGHLEGLQACEGDRVAVYVIGFGNEFDVHGLHFHGQTLEYLNKRGDTINVYSATFVSAEMTPVNPGTYLVADIVDRNQQDGMVAFFTVESCNKTAHGQGSGVVRDYFLAAEEVIWNYGPSGINGQTGLPLTEPGSESETYFGKSNFRIGGQYKKAKFVEYTDNSYNTVVQYPDNHLGILGPVIRAEVGDRLKVHLLNNVQFPVSVLPHGLMFSSQEEALSGAAVPGGAVGQGQRHTYVFDVPEDLLDDAEGPCINMIYTSAHDPSRDHSTGLVGPILICKSGALKPPGSDYFLLLSIIDENKSHFLDDNINTLTSGQANKDDPDFVESNLMYSINGYSFGNIPDLDLCLNDNVTWYVMSLGSDLDVHTVTFDGNAFHEDGRNRDGVSLAPGATRVLYMTPDNLGVWAVFSHTNLARDGGMFGYYNVSDCGFGRNQATRSTYPYGLLRHLLYPRLGVRADVGTQRVYYIAAVEEIWDYAPKERSIVTGADLNDPRNEGNIFIKDDNEFIGDVYKKAIFKEYTDSTFTVEKAEKQQALDLLGPSLRAEVGDTIKIFFKNMASRPYSMHAHGIKTTQAGSGLDYGRATGVDPGQTFVYTWEIPARAGPGPADPNCIPWLYFSSVDPVRDSNSGLLGAMIICRPGVLDFLNQRKDVDREFYILMSVINENLSWYLDDNIKTFAPARIGTDFGSDGDFEESNLMHSINGRLFGNNPELVMEFNETIAWYMLAMGSNVDLHSFHLHGHTFVESSFDHREDTLNLFPGQAESVVMIADNPGTWFLHCHVLDHIAAGMETTYTVLKPGETIQQSVKSDPCPVVVG